MKVASGGCDAGMTEGGLNEVDGGAAVEGVGGVSVTEPVRRNRHVDTGSFGCLFHNAQYSHRLQASTLLPGAKDRIVRTGGTAQRLQLFPDGSGQLDRAGDTSLPQHGDLAAVAVGLQVAPAQGAQLADADPGCI